MLDGTDCSVLVLRYFTTEEHREDCVPDRCLVGRAVWVGRDRIYRIVPNFGVIVGAGLPANMVGIGTGWIRPQAGSYGS